MSEHRSADERVPDINLVDYVSENDSLLAREFAALGLSWARAELMRFGRRRFGYSDDRLAISASLRPRSKSRTSSISPMNG